MRMPNIVICVLPGSTIFFHIFSQTVQFKKNIEIKCGLFFLQLFSEKFLILRISQPGTLVHRTLGEVTVIIFRLY